MLYGLYLSATGVMTNSYRQDVISNNLANAETVGFKKDLAMFRQRPTAAQEDPAKMEWTNPTMEGIGGGIFAEPTHIDITQGPLEPTDNPLDAAIVGSGYFTVDDHGKTRLTRNGQFLINNGQLVTAGSGLPVLDTGGSPIKMDGQLQAQTSITQEGVVYQDGAFRGRLAVVDTPDPAQLKNEGGSLFSYGKPADLTPSANSIVQNKTVENANVDPASELGALMDSQRQLEANANMIHYQDQTLDKLINTVGKIN